MALVHSIGSGADEVVLNNGSTAWTESWGMSNPGQDAQEAVDEHEIELLGGNAAVLATQVKLERWLAQAKRWNDPMTRGADGPVYYNVQLDGATTYRCRLTGGEFTPGPERVKGEWALGRRRGTLRLTRENWIEGAEAQISLTNSNGTDNTAGLNVFWGNNDLSGAAPNKVENSFYITDTKILGDLPALFRLQVAATALASTLEYAVYKKKGAAPTGGTFDGGHWLEAVWGTRTVDGAKTNQDYYSHTAAAITSNVVTLTNFITFGVGDQMYFRFFAALAFATAGVYKVTPKLTIDGTTTISGQPIYINGTTGFKIYDLGTMKYSPYVSTLTNTCSGLITVDTDGATAVHADFLSIVPMQQIRRLTFVSTGANTSTDDMLDAKAVVTHGPTAVVSKGSAVGDVMTLTPGYHHKFYFYLLDHADYVTTYGAMKLWYRPRFLTI